jgi:hypothetical protein
VQWLTINCQYGRLLNWAFVLSFIAVGTWWQWHLPTAGKGGLVLAVGATLMPIFWEKVGVLGKAFWIGMLFLLLGVEYRAIDKDREDTRVAAAESLRKLLETQQTGVANILTQQEHSVKGILEQEQQHFERTLTSVVTAHAREEKDFAALLSQEHALFDQQSSTLDFLTGKLLPANDPTPMAPCGPLAPDEFLVQMGQSGYVTNNLPYNVLVVSKRTVISIDKSETGALLVSINLTAPDGRIVARINKNSLTVNPASTLIITRDRSSLLMQDQYGHDVINARYLNTHAFSITGEIPHTGGNIQLPIPMLGGCIKSTGKIATAVNID